MAGVMPHHKPEGNKEEHTEGLIAQGAMVAGMLQRSPAHGTGLLKPKCPWISKEGERQNERGPRNC